MSRKPPARKRKRFDSSKSNASGISALSDISRVTEEVHDSDESSQSSRQSFDFGRLGSRSNNINQIVEFSVNPSESKRHRRVSWCFEDEETAVKQVLNHSNIRYDNAFGGSKQNQRSTCLDDSARNGGIPHVQSAPVRCQCGKKESKIFVKHCTLTERRRTEIEKQQKIVDHLLKKDRKNTHTQPQRLSVSVSSLRETPTAYAVPLSGNNRGISETQRFRTNRPRAPNGFPNEDRWTYNEEYYRRPNQRRSRSCDFLLNDEENQGFITPLSPNSHLRSVSSGYEDVEERLNLGGNRTDVGNINGNVIQADGFNVGGNVNRTDDVFLDGNGNRTDDAIVLASENETEREESKQCRYNFRKLFYILVAFNTLVILLGIFLLVAWIDKNQDTGICLECQDLTSLGTELPAFQKKNGQCCLQSIQHLFEVFANVTRNAKSRGPQALGHNQQIKEPYRENIPMVQFKADKKQMFDNHTRISWTTKAEWPVQKVFKTLGPDGNTLINIPVSGFYYLYSSVHYKKKYGKEENYLIFGHSVILVHDGIEKAIDSALDTCFPRTAIMRHTSHLNFVQNFTQDDTVYVRLHNEKYFDARNSKLGLFLVHKFDI